MGDTVSESLSLREAIHALAEQKFWIVSANAPKTVVLDYGDTMEILHSIDTTKCTKEHRLDPDEYEMILYRCATFSAENEELRAELESLRAELESLRAPEEPNEPAEEGER